MSINLHFYNKLIFQLQNFDYLYNLYISFTMHLFFNYILFCLIASIEILINNNALIFNFEGSFGCHLGLVAGGEVQNSQLYFQNNR